MLVFYVPNSEVNSRSIDFKIFYILKQQFIESVCQSCKVLVGILRDDSHFAEGQKLRTFTIKIND